MYNIIPLIIILLSLSTIIIIVIRKFSVLANLDIGSIQAEKEAKFKEQIISNRMKRNIIRWKTKFINLLRPIGQGLRNIFLWLYNKLNRIKETYSNKGEVEAEDIPAKIDSLFLEADNLVKKEKLTEAENKYIEIIRLDAKNIKAFRSLGKVFIEKKNYNEAIQTFDHVLKLIDDIGTALPEQAADPVELSMGESRGEINNLELERAALLYNLALAQKLNENTEEALVTLKKALRLEPKNPRYLDTMLELSIMNKEKFLALDAYEKLAEVNPENKKLKELKKQIDEL